MERYQGKTIVNGIAQGTMFTYVRDQFQVEKTLVEDVEKENNQCIPIWKDS